MRNHVLSFLFYGIKSIRRHSSKTKSMTAMETPDLSKIRNIGIFAHIDAGKTTTTERMLFLAGRIPSMGDINHGNTVTDFLEQEKNRGITISSAVVTFPWKTYTINLIDTPGHIDFTMEIEQCLNVIDGGIIILDATSGVEAQTVKIWRQLSKKKLPCIIFANKFDRSGANYSMCLDSLKEKLDLSPLGLQIPITEDGSFKGLIDVPSVSKMVWTGQKLLVDELAERIDDKKHALEERIKLIDSMSSLDDDLANIIVTRESLENISLDEIRKTLRRITLNQVASPVLIGSASKNIGVDLLMDAILQYLPSPLDRAEHQVFNKFKDQPAARIFKIMYTKHRGPITYLRIFNGEFSKGQKVYNLNQEKWEVVGNVLSPFGDDFEEIQTAKNGSVLAVTGFKHSTTGNLICGGPTSVSKVKQELKKSLQLTEIQVNTFLRSDTIIPEPVFFCSVEAPSQAYQTKLERALNEMKIEDPSLKVRYDTETGQTILAGMGELHIEVLKEKLKTDYKLDVYLGSLQIGYKEQLNEVSKKQFHFKSGSHGQQVEITLSLCPGLKRSLVIIDHANDAGGNLTRIHQSQLAAIKQGVETALMHGPKLSSPVVSVHAVLHHLKASRETLPNTLTAAAYQCIKDCLTTSGTTLMEPIMLVDIYIHEDYLNSLYGFMSKRRSKIVEMSHQGKYRELKYLTPLAELLKFSNNLHKLSSGNATFTMTFDHYETMNVKDESDVISKQFGSD